MSARNRSLAAAHAASLAVHTLCFSSCLTGGRCFPKEGSKSKKRERPISHLNSNGILISGELHLWAPESSIRILFPWHPDCWEPRACEESHSVVSKAVRLAMAMCLRISAVLLSPPCLDCTSPWDGAGGAWSDIRRPNGAKAAKAEDKNVATSWRETACGGPPSHPAGPPRLGLCWGPRTLRNRTWMKGVIYGVGATYTWWHASHLLEREIHARIRRASLA